VLQAEAKTIWNELMHLFVIRHGDNTKNDTAQLTDTMILKAELEIYPFTNDKKTRLIQKGYYEILKDADTGKKGPIGSMETLFPPITAINYENSALADGFITFLQLKRRLSTRKSNYGVSSSLQPRIKRRTNLDIQAELWDHFL